MAKKTNKHDQWLKKLGYKEKTIHMGMFDYSVCIVIGEYKNIDEYISFKFEEDDFESAYFDNGFNPRGRCFYKPGYVPVVWIPRKPKLPREYATLSHECLHAMFHVSRWAGFPINDSTEEVMTHGMAHLINEALK